MDNAKYDMFRDIHPDDKALLKKFGLIFNKNK